MKYLLQATVDLEVDADTPDTAAYAAAAALKAARTRTVAIVDVLVAPA